uniref:Putative dehydrogenase with different specificities related to short-chain alcohol dehydrogenase n=2 Tax=Ornithodoros turicata TaxID=34597 RepID=A0A2R5LJG3_9ACAR
MGIKSVGLCVVVGIITCYVIRRWRVRTWGRCRSKKSMIGKTVIITGANSGLGKATAAELALRGAKVILACRDISGGLAAATEIRYKTSADTVVVRYLDLSSFASIRSFVNNILKTEMHIDALVNNAGVFQCPYATTKEGYELQIGVNHLGHFLLTNLLLQRLKNSQPSRVVVVTSHLYRKGNIKAPDLVMKEHEYNKKKAYVNSKLANVLFARELSRRLKGSGVRVYAVSPGMVYTNLGRHRKLPWYLVVLLLPFALFAVRTPDQGCQSIVDCVVNEEYEQHTGKYYRNCKPEKWEPIALDDDLALKVWTASESLTGVLSAETLG